jgi:FeS assembly SUF system protein
LAFTVHAPPSEYMLSDIVGNAGEVEPEPLLQAIVAALRQVNDPEIPVNIYDLGLIYRIDIAADGDVDIDMTLTRASCPVAGMMPLLVKNAVGSVDGVGLIKVKMVWDPPWNQERLSDEVKLALGIL